MSSREQILARLRQHRFEAALPEVPAFGSSGSDLLTEFGRSVEKNAGRFIACFPDDVDAEIR